MELIVKKYHKEIYLVDTKSFKVYSTDSLSKFASEFDISYQNLRNLVAGRTQIADGFTTASEEVVNSLINK